MEPSAQPIANPAVIGQEILDGEMILVNTETSASLALQNPTAVAIWTLVDGERTVGDIIAAVEQRFEETPPTVTQDVVSVLDALAAGGFLLLQETD